jgi:hypothetical protein
MSIEVKKSDKYMRVSGAEIEVIDTRNMGKISLAKEDIQDLFLYLLELKGDNVHFDYVLKVEEYFKKVKIDRYEHLIGFYSGREHLQAGELGYEEHAQEKLQNAISKYREVTGNMNEFEINRFYNTKTIVHSDNSVEVIKG